MPRDMSARSRVELVRQDRRSALTDLPRRPVLLRLGLSGQKKAQTRCVRVVCVARMAGRLAAVWANRQQPELLGTYLKLGDADNSPFRASLVAHSPSQCIVRGVGNAEVCLNWRFAFAVCRTEGAV